MGLSRNRHFILIRRRLALIAVAVFAIVAPRDIHAANTPQVTLNVSKATPRQVEELTEKSILRDYKFAWTNLALAFESSSTGPLNGLFTGNASAWLNDAVKSQKRNGLTGRYLNQ